MTDRGRLRIAVVGPTHPLKGGVAAHTTALAHELAEAGHEVALVSWRRLYPSRLHPGDPVVPDGSPDVEPFPATTRPLSWARPASWWRTGRGLRDADVVLVVHVIPAVVPAHLALIRAARGGSAAPNTPGPTVVAVVHNVLPHEARPGDELLMRRLLGSVDAVLVHSAEQAALAHRLGAADVSIAALPPHLPGGPPLASPRRDGPVSLLALGIVRDYKGVDLVLEALREVPDLRLTIAGELWGAAGERVRMLAREPALAGRVSLREGYVPAGDIAPLLAEHDVLVLAYRSATGSQNVLLAHHHGLPVLATEVGTLAHQVRPGVDGLVIPPEDHEALGVALRRLADRDLVDELRQGIRPPDLSGPWARYVAAIETIAALEPVSPDAREPSAGPSRLLAPGGLRAATLVRPEIDLQIRDLPEWVHPTDVLATPEEAAEVVDLARALGLPRPSPRGAAWGGAWGGARRAARGAAAWAALGALSAVLRVRDGDRRSSVIVDSSGPSSVFSRWARAIGYAPVALDTADGDLDPGSLDVIARLHPHGCTSTDVDAALGEAARLLRRGGLLTLTLPVTVTVTVTATATATVRVPDLVESARLAVGRGRRTASRALSTGRLARGASAPADPSRTTAATALVPADLRAVVARADTLGLSLVGDLDRDIAPRLTSRPTRSDPSHGETGAPGATGAPEASGAYALVRLTFRRTGA